MARSEWARPLTGQPSAGESTVPVPCAADGTFTLAAMPRRGAWLEVRIGGALRQLLPVEAISDAALIAKHPFESPMVLVLAGLALLGRRTDAQRAGGFVSSTGL